MLCFTQSLSLCVSFLESLTASQVAPTIHKQHIIRDIQTFDTTEARIKQDTLICGALTTEIQLLAAMIHLRISEIRLLFLVSFTNLSTIHAGKSNFSPRF